MVFTDWVADEKKDPPKLIRSVYKYDSGKLK